jgi:hypothetical protein
VSKSEGCCLEKGALQYWYAETLRRGIVPRSEAVASKRDMFNVLVNGNATAWETDQLMRMDAERFKEPSGSQGEFVSTGKPETLKALEQIPTLLMYERGCSGPNTDVVRYGALGDIKAVGKELVFRFDEEGILSRAVVEEFSDRLGMSHFEHCRTHWAIKDGGIPTGMLSKIRRDKAGTYLLATPMRTRSPLRVR